MPEKFALGLAVELVGDKDAVDRTEVTGHEPEPQGDGQRKRFVGVARDEVRLEGWDLRSDGGATTAMLGPRAA